MKKAFCFDLKTAVKKNVLKKMFVVFFFAFIVLGVGDTFAVHYFMMDPLPAQVPGGARKIEAGLSFGTDDLVALDQNGAVWSYDGTNKSWTQMTESRYKYAHLTKNSEDDEYYLYLIHESGLMYRKKRGSAFESVSIPAPFNAVAGCSGEYATDRDGNPWYYEINEGTWNKITTINSIPARGDQVIMCVYQRKIIDNGQIFMFTHTTNSFYVFQSFRNPGFLISSQPQGWMGWNIWLPAMQYPVQVHPYFASKFETDTICLTDNIGVVSQWSGGTWVWEEMALTQPWLDVANIDYNNVYLLAADGQIWHGEVLDNDVPCANRILGIQMSAEGSTLGRNSSGYSACGGYGGDFTYLWTAPRSGTYVFNTVGSNFDTVLYLKTVCGGSPIRCDDDSGGNLTSRLEYTVNQGDKLLITVDGYGPSSQGAYKLNIKQKGYECANTEINGLSNGIVAGSTDKAANRVTSNCGGAGPDITFLWRAPESAVYVFDTQNSKFDTVLSLRATCGGSVLKCDDDSGGNTTSKFEYAVTKGKLYLITVDGYYATSKGNYNLRILKK